MRSVVLALALLAGCAKPATLADHVHAAAEQEKPLVVEFYADWCAPCRIFEEQVLTDPRVTAALRDVVFVRYDIDTRTGGEAAGLCQVTKVPSMVGIDAAGFVRTRKQGTESTADQFLQFLADTKAAISGTTPAAPPPPGT